jgi:predicted aconitase with swiveling domain
MLVGCNGAGSQVPSLVSNAIQQAAPAGRTAKLDAATIALTTRDHIVPTVHLNTAKSWMEPNAKDVQYLLYTSDEATGTVNVYAYRSKGHLVGQLTGFQFPYGECLDAGGNVYVADFAANQIVEYAHGGTTPIKTLSDAYGFPIGCSVDPKTGNLAVSNFEGLGSTCMGGIVIYTDASGSGTLYQDKSFNYYWPPGYDSQGNLYVEGRRKEDKGKAGLASIPYGSSKLVTLSLSGGTIKYPGSVQWDGHYVTATDQAYAGTHLTAIYRVTVSGSRASVVDSSLLSDICLKGKVPYNDVVQPWINGTTRKNDTVVGGNLACDYRFGFWPYTQGGDPKKALPYNAAPQLSAGQTVSAVKKS